MSVAEVLTVACYKGDCILALIHIQASSLKTQWQNTSKWTQVDHRRKGADDSKGFWYPCVHSTQPTSSICTGYSGSDPPASSLASQLYPF